MTEKTFFDSFNAKHKSDGEIASTFVPLTATLNKIISKSHVVISGPRGSGKTTLLKMLTIPALSKWNGDDAEGIKSKINFVSVFVPADRSWHGQLTTLSKSIVDEEVANVLGMSTFTTHIFKAMVSAFESWGDFDAQKDVFLNKLVPPLSLERERELVARLSDVWMLSPRAPTFFELKASLSDRLSQIGIIKNKLKFNSECLHEVGDFIYLDYREGLTEAVSLHNKFSEHYERRWSFLFDELEVAPSFIQKSLFLDLRGAAEGAKINYKLAIAPFNKNFQNLYSEINASQRNDYIHINLSFPRKDDSYEFSRRLANSMVKGHGLSVDISQIFGNSLFSFEDEDSSSGRLASGKYSKDGKIGKILSSLAAKDSSFRNYLIRRNIDLSDISSLDEASIASTLRKIRNIVIIRDFFSKASKSGLEAEKLSNRSRKSYSLYTGIPSVFALVEGNPRALINLLEPIILEYKRTETTSKTFQAEEISRSISIMRSLLKTISIKGGGGNNGLLGFLDKVGEALYNGVVDTKFRDQPPLSFTVDHGLGIGILDAVGKALNIGAIVHVPDGAAEDVLSTVIGRRFRLNYLLAVYYKLPLSLDRSVKLSSLVSSSSNFNQKELEFPDDIEN